MTRDSILRPSMVIVPGGEFTMGESSEDKFANDTERPAHCVSMAPFALARFVVTVGQYRAFCAAYAPDEDAQLPAVNVSWNDARAYCDWLSVQLGTRYRLSSEAEWEYACRAGTRTPFAFGHEITPREANYFYSESGERVGPGRRTLSGDYPTNAFGLHDMHGNVCEWVEDRWRPNYSAAIGEGDLHVIRGGAWDYLPRLLRSAWRDALPADCRRDNVGFRIATSDISA